MFKRFNNYLDYQHYNNVAQVETGLVVWCFNRDEEYISFVIDQLSKALEYRHLAELEKSQNE